VGRVVGVNQTDSPRIRPFHGGRLSVHAKQSFSSCVCSVDAQFSSPGVPTASGPNYPFFEPFNSTKEPLLNIYFCTNYFSYLIKSIYQYLSKLIKLFTYYFSNLFELINHYFSF